MNAVSTIPSEIAATIIDPTSYTDDAIIYPALKWLRDNMPVGRAYVEGYDPIWVLSKYDDIKSVSFNAKAFNNGNNNLILQTQQSDDYTRSMNEGRVGSMNSIAFMDQPQHSQYRGIVGKRFMPAAILEMEQKIRQIAKESVDQLCDLGEDVDLVNDFIVNYPLRVAMNLLGVPEKDEQLMLRLTQKLFGWSDPEQGREEIEAGPEAAGRAWQATLREFYDYFEGLSQERRKNPVGDIISIIANHKIDGEYLADYLEYDYYVAIATAGHDTTSYASAGGILGLIQYPDQFELLKNKIDLVPKFVEEAVRWSTPVKHFMRTSAFDTEIHGQTVCQNDRIMLSYPSANRDESIYENGDDFIIDRNSKSHLSFGFGPHTCLGRNLALLDMKILFEELIPRLESIELAGDPKYLHSNFITGIKTMPVKIKVR